MKNNLKMGLGILTVLATPLAVDAATGSNEAHAVQVKETAKKQVVTSTKQTTTTKQTETAKKTENTKKDASKEKTTSSVKTVSDKTQTAKSNPVEKKTGWTTNGTYYVNGKLANWWYDDGKDWYFFQNGKKHTGEGKDNAGKHYFSNGKYASGYQNGIYYAKGKAANWWYDDGKDWYYFKDGKKFTGIANDNSGKHEFINGKYAQKGGKAQGAEATSNQYSGHYKVTGLYIPVYDGNGKILSHISQGTIVFKDNRASASGRIPVQVAGLVGYVNPSQVQAVNSSTTFIPDYVSDGKYVYHRYSKYSSIKVAYHNSSMQVGKSYYSADGINFGSFKLEHPFQFSNLKSKTNYTAADINKLYTLMGASNSMLAGKGAAFKAAEQKYGVNALYLVAHSALESAWGRSNIAKAKNNFFGTFCCCSL